MSKAFLINRLPVRLVFCLFLLVAIPTHVMAADHRLAVVIGNSNYVHAQTLKHPGNDASAVAAKLRQLGFDVVLKKNLKRRAMREVLQQLASAPPGSTLLFYYAGHAMQIEGRNYFLPVDFRPEAPALPGSSETTLKDLVEAQTLNMREVLSAMERSQAKVMLLILDACRDNDFGLDVRGGLAEVDASPGTLFAYAAMPGGVAYDGAGKNSIYTESLLKYLGMTCLSVNDMLNLVGKEVFEKTHAIIRKNNLSETPQQPWVSNSPMTRFSFAGCSNWEEIEDLLDSFVSAFESKSIEGVKQIVKLNYKQERNLKKIFDAFSEIHLQTSHPDLKSPKFATARVRIASLENSVGNVVTPPPKWGDLNLKIRKVNGKWRDIRLEWGMDYAD